MPGDPLPGRACAIVGSELSGTLIYPGDYEPDNP